MRRKTMLAGTTLLAAALLQPVGLAQSSEAFGRLVRTVMNGATDPVRSLRFGITIETGSGGPESLTMEQDLSYELPDKLRNAVRTPLGRQVIVVNGKRGAALAAGRAQPASAERIEYGRQSMGRLLLVLVGNAGDPELRATDRGTEAIDGAACDVVEVSYMGAESTLWIDGEGQALRQRFEGRHFFEGRRGVVEIAYSDTLESQRTRNVATIYIYPARRTMLIN